MELNHTTTAKTADSYFPITIKIGRSEYVIERHFTSNRMITDALYKLIRVEDTLDDSGNSEKLSVRV